MKPLTSSIVVGILGSVGVVLAYGLSLWRMFSRSRGDRFVEFACITVMLFVVVLRLIKIPDFPAWILQPVEVLLGLLSFVTVFFMCQQLYRAVRRRRTQ
jgi:hypothetical protein